MYDELVKSLRDMSKMGTKYGMAVVKMQEAADAIEELSAKSTPKRVGFTGWKGCRDTRYKCPYCNKYVRNDEKYCHKCGQALMFPHISHTPYVPGEKQEVIVTWPDEPPKEEERRRTAETRRKEMSILIRGMEMPVTCCYCPLIGYDPEIEWNDSGREVKGAHVCVMTHELIDNTKREDHCPLVPVPPHGRCVDADKLMQEMRLFIKENMLSRDDARELLETIKDAPTVIEAEEGE